MKYNIAIGNSRFTRVWKNEAVTWEWLRERLKSPTVTPETMAEYRAMGRDRQTEVKDVGGFVGGYLDGGRRSASTVRSRQLITLDYDDFDADRLAKAREALTGRLWCCHSTHKHRSDAWRVRMVVAADRSMTPDEYGASARKLAEKIGLRGIDRSTFEPCRLMFWPSRSTDAPYLFTGGQGDPVSVDGLLGEYVDWRDMSAWPLVEEEFAARGEIAARAASGTSYREGKGSDGWPGGPAASKAFAERGRHGVQEDPRGKKGIVGAFCRSYDIHGAISAFLAETYTRCGENRYTHVGSTTSGGAWVLDDGRFLYSFHGTDPAQGKLLNSWDLVRTHRFGHLDCETRERKTDRLPSYKAMEELAKEDVRVKGRLMDERRAGFLAELEGMETAAQAASGTSYREGKGEDEGAQSAPFEEDWERAKEGLKVNSKGVVESSITSAQIILEWHPTFRDKLRANLFTGDIDVEGHLPWKRHTAEWTNADDSALRGWLDAHYGLTGEKKIADALTNVTMKHGRHPVREYLASLSWDGVERLGGLFVDVIGAEDTALNRELAKLIFTAACRRVFQPGCKFDYLVILQGPEGCGKSSLFSLMAGERWFSDSVVSIDGKDGMDSLAGVWIAEMGELVGMKRAEMTTVKNYISRQADKWRPAYKPRVETHPRQCILVGTTNDEYFIRGINDKNRRFPVVECRPELRKEEGGVWEYIPRWRDQLWAEAMELHRKGKRIWLPSEYDPQIKEIQDRHNLDVSNPVFPEVERFLDAWLPANWETTDIDGRRQWWRSQNAPTEESVFGGYRRDTATIAEIMREMLGKEPTDRDYRGLSREIGQYMQRLSDTWEPVGQRRTRLYGSQKTWKRKRPPIALGGGRGDPLSEL